MFYKILRGGLLGLTLSTPAVALAGEAADPAWKATQMTRGLAIVCTVERAQRLSRTIDSEEFRLGVAVRGCTNQSSPLHHSLVSLAHRTGLERDAREQMLNAMRSAIRDRVTDYFRNCMRAQREEGVAEPSWQLCPHGEAAYEVASD